MSRFGHVIALALVACSPEPSVRFGAPNAMMGADADDLFPEKGAGAQSPAGGSDAGDASACAADAGGDGALDPSCPTFERDVYARLGSAGCTSAACHGGSTRPPISAADPATAYDQLTNAILVGGKR